MIYYLDKTWVNAGHTITKKWVNSTVTSAREAFLNDLSTGVKDPSGKEDGILIFEPKKKGDYHEEMNLEIFEKWFKNILTKVEDNAVIVMDNTAYNSRRSEKVPTANMRKAEIQAWLESKNIAFEYDMIKVELLQLVRENRPLENKCVVDEIAKAAGRIVLRLPPYHSQNNRTYKLDVVKGLFLQHVKDILPAN
ncbi:uncharacterized protein LOC135120750 [Zophobas morio]|uniref:uncharacterized protein LOC135120750 n=1 Tax=Zophobas morio TaxID=2755281 RepID=UPI00308323F5